MLNIPQPTTDGEPKYLKATDFTNGSMGILRAKILYTLDVYPRLSPSMLQVGIGPSISPAMWRPVLQEMIKEGLVDSSEVEKTTIHGRFNRHTVLSLTPMGQLLIG